MHILRTPNKISSKTRRGPVGPIGIIGCPASRAKKTPAADVETRVSDIPIRFMVFSLMRPAKVMTWAMEAQYMKIIVPKHCKLSPSRISDLYFGIRVFSSFHNPPKGIPVLANGSGEYSFFSEISIHFFVAARNNTKQQATDVCWSLRERAVSPFIVSGIGDIADPSQKESFDMTNDICFLSLRFWIFLLLDWRTWSGRRSWLSQSPGGNTMLSSRNSLIPDNRFFLPVAVSATS